MNIVLGTDGDIPRARIVPSRPGHAEHCCCSLRLRECFPTILAAQVQRVLRIIFLAALCESWILLDGTREFEHP